MASDDDARGIELPGMTQWFVFGDRETVARTVALLHDLSIRRFRTLFSWADWTRPDGPAWLDDCMDALAGVPELDIVPALFYTPPALARPAADGEQRTSAPPQDLSAYAAFVREMIGRYGERFEWVQLWNEPNWQPYWDQRIDPDGSLFALMANEAADAARAAGKRVLLGGVTPLEYAWFTRMHELGVLDRVDGISFHYSPSWPNQHRRWFALPTEIAGLRALLRGLGHGDLEVWMDESGLSTQPADGKSEQELEDGQIAFFDSLLRLPVERCYWFCAIDQHPEHETDDMLNAGTPADLTAYHFGLLTQDGRAKPLVGHWRTLAGERRLAP
ncbi:MAG TPA: hypothetical protein VFL98_01080 [Candidatus Paceibacterota bacterium]|nr:hypothetical protein [Candidatus Paceibacterota bacterium]